MSWNETEILGARRAILEAAQAMLTGRLSYIEGARRIVAFWRTSKLDQWDSDFLPFVGIDSDTEALPLGKMRIHWNATALENLQPEIERSEAWARKIGEPFCHNLVRRLSEPSDGICQRP